MRRRVVLAAVALVLVGSALPRPALGRLRVACTLSTIESLVREIGGDRVEVFSLAAGDQDPHFVAPTPSLMKRVREADLLFEIGMQLDAWADEVANGSGNPRIFRGAAGRLALSAGIPKLEVPALLSRSQGDIHPEGNPHLWLDPVRARMLAENVARALAAAAPGDRAFFDGRLRAFQKRVDERFYGPELLKAVGAAKLGRLTLDGRLGEFLESNQLGGKPLAALAGGWLARARPLRGAKAIEFHKVWAYFAQTFGLLLVGTIEEKPGIPPGPRHVAATIETMKRDGVRLVMVDNFYDPALAQRIGREAGAAIVILPNQVRGEKGLGDWFALMDHLIGALVRALPAGTK